jgi:glutathione reductase (NADPH)
MTHDVDLFVIGGGSGGVRVARVAAEHGARVAIAESRRWGGTCVIRGCVPKKLFVYASEVSRTLDDARGQGWTIGETRFDWTALREGKDRELARLERAYADRLRKAGVRILEDRARIVDAHAIEIGGQRITAANIVVATGGAPVKPLVGEWITSDDVFDLRALPRSLHVLGGGYIGVEFAHVFAGLGVAVTLVKNKPRVLRGFDPDVQDEVERGLVAHGVKIVQGDHATHVGADLALAAIGRRPTTAGLGLAEIGVSLDARGAVVVDEWSRSTVPHVYAIGDCTARVQLTPVAIREGQAVADTLFGNRPTPIRYDLIPTAVFAQPPAASIGLAEPAARVAGHDVRVFRARFRPMRYALSGRDEHVMIKLVVDGQTDRVLGLHVVGVDAPEIVQAAAIAVTMGATKADLDRTFACHPTTAEELVLLR